jgi:hypothetical protein
MVVSVLHSQCYHPGDHPSFRPSEGSPSSIYHNPVRNCRSFSTIFTNHSQALEIECVEATARQFRIAEYRRGADRCTRRSWDAQSLIAQKMKPPGLESCLMYLDVAAARNHIKGWIMLVSFAGFDLNRNDICLMLSSLFMKNVFNVAIQYAA